MSHVCPCDYVYVGPRLVCVKDVRIAELEAALRSKQDQWEVQCRKTGELEAEVERLRKEGEECWCRGPSRHYHFRTSNTTPAESSP